MPFWEVCTCKCSFMTAIVCFVVLMVAEGKYTLFKDYFIFVGGGQ